LTIFLINQGKTPVIFNPLFKTGFVRSWKTRKSHAILKWLFPGLEKSFENIKSQKFWKSHANLLYSYVHLYCMLWNSHCLFKYYIFSLFMYTPSFHKMFGHGNLFYGPVNPLFNMCMNPLTNKTRFTRVNLLTNYLWSNRVIRVEEGAWLISVALLSGKNILRHFLWKSPTRRNI